MAKVFTIAEGLENMGAIRTGGQGSVYKGKRMSEMFVAVKLLPTPIHVESEDDKNYRDFRNEVEKLKMVNEEPNPHVVKILNSGITESGSLPFIEMEFIDGPDLEDLLKSPHDPVFLISEIIKVANQLANALGHCHKFGVKHGDIKSNNVKFNIHTDNYILLDFGLAIMSDEQRRSSLKHAGAVEFMAPEQNEGTILFQSDIYGYGIILFQLIAGTVPYPLKDNGKSAHNMVMISHMETPLPDVLELREKHFPADWPAEKKEQEIQVPEWLINVMKKCLEKNADDRFADGTILYQTILQQNSAAALKNDLEGASVMQAEIERLHALVLQEQEKAASNERQVLMLKEEIAEKAEEISTLTRNRVNPVEIQGTTQAITAKPAFSILIGLLIFFCGAGAYWLLSGKTTRSTRTVANGDSARTPKALVKPIQNGPEHLAHRKIKTASPDTAVKIKPQQSTAMLPVRENNPGDSTETTNSNRGKSDIGKVFTLAGSFAYFHNSPDEATRRNAFINRWNYARLTALDDVNGFIYVIYKNDEGQITKGWLNKKDLKIVRK